jgi:branched-subunit amino acid transport protein
MVEPQGRGSMIESSYFWWSIFFLSIGTLGIRGSIIAASEKIEISARHREIFTFIPAAIIPAIVVPMVFFHQGQVPWLLGKERLFTLVLATVVCFYSRNMLVTVGFGLAALYFVCRF